MLGFYFTKSKFLLFQVKTCKLFEFNGVAIIL